MNQANITYIDPRLIKTRENFNPRIKPFTEDIKPSISKDGVRESVEAVDNGDGTYTLNAQGHRRLLACQELLNEGHDKLLNGEPLLFPIRVVADTGAEGFDKLRLDILTLNTGRPLEFMEEAKVIRDICTDEEGKLLAKTLLGGKIKLIASETGKSENAIRNYLTIGEASPVVLKLIEDSRVSPSLVLEAFLGGEAKGDWSKVETKMVEAVSTAAAAGKTTATKKHTSGVGNPKAGGVSSTAAPVDPNAAEAAAAKAAKDAEIKENAAVISRVGKYGDHVFTLKKENEEGAEFAFAQYDYLRNVVVYLDPSRQAELFTVEELPVGAAIKLADVQKAFKAIGRTAFAFAKMEVDAERKKKDAEFAGLKEQIKALSKK